MRIRLAIPDRLISPEAMEAALEATTLANQAAIEQGEVPPITEAIRKGIRWKPEPFTDGEHFDLAEQVMGRGWGDCDDLAPWLAAEMRAHGVQAKPRVYQSGPGRWHVVVESEGEIIDPSRWAGMGKHGEVSGVHLVNARPMAHPGRGALAIVPHGGVYHARCDTPYPGVHGAHIASHSVSRDPEDAIIRSINGAIMCGEAVGSDCEHASLCGSLMIGDAEELVEVGFLPGLSAITSAASSVAKGLFGKKKRKRPATPPPGSIQHKGGAVSMPVKRGNGERPMMLSYYPAYAQGPVVMRF